MSEFFASGMHWKIFNFAVFIFLLVHFLKKPVRDFWQGRSNQIRTQLNEASQLAHVARERHEQLKIRLSGLEEETRSLLKQMNDDAELEKKFLADQAARLSVRLSEENEHILDQELRRAHESLKEATAHLVIEIAEKILREQIRPEDQQKLSDTYLKDLEKGAA